MCEAGPREIRHNGVEGHEEVGPSEVRAGSPALESLWPLSWQDAEALAIPALVTGVVPRLGVHTEEICPNSGGAPYDVKGDYRDPPHVKLGVASEQRIRARSLGPSKARGILATWHPSAAAGYTAYLPPPPGFSSASLSSRGRSRVARGCCGLRYQHYRGRAQRSRRCRAMAVRAS